MKIDTNTLISISDANQNFSKVTKLVDKYGAAIILKTISLYILLLNLLKRKIMKK